MSLVSELLCNCAATDEDADPEGAMSSLVIEIVG